MKTSTLGLGLIAAVALTTLVVSTPTSTYAQDVTSDTESTQVEGPREMKEGGMKRGHKMGGMRVGKEFFEDLSDEQQEEMKAELEALRGENTKEDIEAMSEEEREGFHIEMQAQRKEIMEKYVDDGELEAYEAFRVEQEAKRAEMKENGEGNGKRGKKNGKGNMLQKFVSYVATMDADQKAELLEKIDGKVEAMTTRIEASDDTDAEKATKIERITGMIEMIKSFLS